MQKKYGLHGMSHIVTGTMRMMLRSSNLPRRVWDKQLHRWHGGGSDDIETVLRNWRLETGDCHNPTIREWRWYNIWQTALPDNVYSRTWPKMTLWKAVGNARKRSLCSTKTQANEMWIFILKCLSKNNEGINYYFYEK